MPTLIGFFNGGFVGWLGGMAGMSGWGSVGCAVVSSLLMCAFGWAVSR